MEWAILIQKIMCLVQMTPLKWIRIHFFSQMISIYVHFVYLCGYKDLAAACGIFCSTVLWWIFNCNPQTIISCGMWYLAPWPRMEPRPLHWKDEIFSHWTTREVPDYVHFNGQTKEKASFYQLLIRLTKIMQLNYLPQVYCLVKLVSFQERMVSLNSS